VSASTSVTTFAASALFLGDSTRDGTIPDPKDTAWATFGYDIDHRTTIAWSPDVCVRSGNGFENTSIDGEDGIDNAFGDAMLLFISYGTGAADLTGDATKLIASGQWTLQVRVTGLSGDAKQSAMLVAGETFISGAYGGTPSFDGTTSWPVRPNTRVQFDTVYVNAGTVVLRDAEQPLELPIQLLNYFYSDPKPPVPVTLTLRVHTPIVTFDLSSGSGTIAGVLETDEAIASARVLGGELGSCFYFESDLISAQDILTDGGNAPNVPCDAISIGLGFTAKQVANPPESGTDPAPLPDPCGPDASLDGGADAD
jgi:hypothetical protein